MKREMSLESDPMDTKPHCCQSRIIPARNRGKTIHKVGINFSYKEGVKNIYDWKEEIEN